LLFFLIRKFVKTANSANLQNRVNKIFLIIYFFNKFRANFPVLFARLPEIDTPWIVIFNQSTGDRCFGKFAQEFLKL